MLMSEADVRPGVRSSFSPQRAVGKSPSWAGGIFFPRNFEGIRLRDLGPFSHTPYPVLPWASSERGGRAGKRYKNLRLRGNPNSERPHIAIWYLEVGHPASSQKELVTVE